MLKIFVFIDIWFVKQDMYSKMDKDKDMQFFMENLKMKRKKDKKILTWDLNPRFSVIFPPMIWIWIWSEEPDVKSKQASKRDRTLYLPKAINGFDGQGHSGSHGSNNKNSNTHDPEYFSFGSIRPEDQFVNISGKHGRCWQHRRICWRHNSRWHGAKPKKGWNWKKD